MKVLVVGGAGYLGSALVPKLQELGHAVTVVDLCWFGNHLPEGTQLLKMSAENLTLDIVRAHEAVIYLAGLSNDPMADFDPLSNFVYNSAVPGYVANLCAKSGTITRFIHGSSCSVYGRIPDGELADECTSPKTRAPYGISKLMAEIAVSQQQTERMSVLNFRMGTICGYSPRMRFDLIINAMVKDALMLGMIKVNDPDARRPILDIRDAVDAYCAVLTLTIYNGTKNLYSFNGRVEEIAKMVQGTVGDRVGCSRPEIAVWGEPDIRSYSVKSTSLPIVRRHAAIETVRDVVSHFNQFVGADPLNNPIFYNVETYKRLTLSPAA